MSLGIMQWYRLEGLGLLLAVVQPPDTGVQVGGIGQPSTVGKEEPGGLSVGGPVEQFRHIPGGKSQGGAVDKCEASLRGWAEWSGSALGKVVM